MKKSSLIVFTIACITVTGCLIKKEIYPRSVLDCEYTTTVDGKDKENRVVLSFNDKKELIKYDYSSKTFYDAIDYAHYKGIDEESKRDFIYNDAELSITYKKTEIAPFTWSGAVDKNHPSKYDDVKVYYLNKSYTCNGEVSKQIAPTEIFGRLITNPFIIISERIYFNDPYNYFYLSSVTLDGKNKEVFISDDVRILFVFGDYLYVEKYDKGKTTYAKINIKDKTDVISLGDKIIFDPATMYDDFGRLNELSTTGFYNKRADSITSQIDLIYKGSFITNTKTKIIYNDETIYSGLNISNTSIFGNSLYFIDSNKLIKLDLETKEETEIKIGNIKINMSDSNRDGVIYASNKGIYKLNYSDFSFVQIAEINEEKMIEMKIVESKLVYVIDNSNQTTDSFEVVVYDMVKNESEVFENITNYQVYLDKIYIIENDGKITIK